MELSKTKPLLSSLFLMEILTSDVFPTCESCQKCKLREGTSQGLWPLWALLTDWTLDPWGGGDVSLLLTCVLFSQLVAVLQQWSDSLTLGPSPFSWCVYLRKQLDYQMQLFSERDWSFLAAHWINDQDKTSRGCINWFWKLVKMQDFILTNIWIWYVFLVV